MPTGLIRREPQPISFQRRRPPQLLAEYSILFAEILDHILLALIHPSSDGDHNELKRIERSCHGPGDCLIVVQSKRFRHPDSSFRAVRLTRYSTRSRESERELSAKLNNPRRQPI